jgi:hypothetical protein
MTDLPPTARVNSRGKDFDQAALPFERKLVPINRPLELFSADHRSLGYHAPGYPSLELSGEGSGETE